MLCPKCHGRRLLDLGGVVIPCQECGGMGEIHCCDGLIVQVGSSEPDCPNRIAVPRPAPVAAQR